MNFLHKIKIRSLWLSMMLPFAAAAAEVQVEVQKFGDVTHLEFTGGGDWSPSRQKDGDHFTIQVPKLNQQSLIDLKILQDHFIKKVNVEAGVNGNDSITFILTSSDVQAFDYLTDQPSKIIIDFFKSDKTKNAKTAEAESKKASKIAKAQSTKRKPAGTDFITAPQGQNYASVPNAEKKPHGVFDGADPEYSRFDIRDYEIKESSIIASRRNLYIKFPVLSQKDDYLDQLLKNPASYEIKPEDNEENKKARLLVTLFNNKRRAVFLTTLKLFRQEFPKSKYDEIIGYLEADTFYRLWQAEHQLSDFQIAMTKYKALTYAYPDSPLRERTLLLIGYSLADRGDYLGSYTEFQRFVRENKTSPFAKQVQMSEVDSLIKLNRFDDAVKLLTDIENDKEMGKYAVDATFKKGDAYFLMNNYSKAISEYETALKKYPEWASQYPNAYYNSAEALFWQAKYKASLEMYREFIKRFPASSHDGYAMTRIGELLEILGAPEDRVTGAFLESIFRYKGSQGAGVANIRLLGSRIQDKKQKEIDDQVKEIETFIKTSDLARLDDFKNIMLSDGYFTKKEFTKSLELLVNFYQQHPTSNNLDVFHNRIVKNLTEQIYNQVQKKDYLEAIKIYGKNSSSWLKNADRLDLQYDVAQSFESTGVFNEAAQRYREILNKLYAIQNTNEQKEKTVFERLPSTDQVNLRLANVSYSLSDFAKAKDYLNAASESGLASENEKIDRIYLASLVFEKMGQTQLAINYLKDLTETWKGQPENVSGIYLRLGKLLSQQKDYKSAEAAFDRILSLADDSKVVPERIHFETLQAKADLLVQTNKRNDAIQVYKNLLGLYENKYPCASVRYKLGKIYYETGNSADAAGTWAALANKPEAKFWNNLAQEQLSQAKWEEDYKKYVNRIPAMTTEKPPTTGAEKGTKGEANDSAKK